MKRVLDIEVWMLLMVAMLLTACSDHSGEGSDEKGDCFLNIYVYAPEHPMLTRADVGTIASRTAKEHEVKTLQIWVFKHGDGSLVGYLETEPTFLNETPGQEMFQMKVEKEFADHPVNVDVYVVANAYVLPDNYDKFINCNTNYDLTYIDDNHNEVTLTLGESTTRTQLDAAKIGVSSFGVVEKEGETGYFIPGVSEVPAAGLPMSGVEKDQPIYGSYPTLRVGTQDAMTTVQLTRAVSKLRFVLCRKTEDLTNAKKILVSVDNIQLDGNVIPTASYLMPKETPSYTSYVLTPISYGSVSKETLPEQANPMEFMYETQTAQEYEDMINAEVAKNIADPTKGLKQLGLTYLRESDKQLTGTITYTYKDRESLTAGWVEHSGETVTFSMADAGDFLRNHSWIVYVFYMDSKIYTLTVTNIGMKVWTSGGLDPHPVYNW